MLRSSKTYQRFLRCLGRLLVTKDFSDAWSSMSLENSLMFRLSSRVLQKVLSLGSDYFSATFYQTYFYYKPSKYSPFTETHFCNLFTQSRKADK